MRIDLPDESATQALGQRLAPLLRPGDVVLLEGDLGTGKTTLARSLIRALCGDPETEVPSPTFTLVQTYECALGELWHFDLYRLCGPDEVLELGWEEALSGAVLVEWPDRLGPFAPAAASRLVLEHRGEEGRTARLSGPLAERWNG